MNSNLNDVPVNSDVFPWIMISFDGEWITLFSRSSAQKKGLKELDPVWILQCWTQSIFGATVNGARWTKMLCWVMMMVCANDPRWGWKALYERLHVDDRLKQPETSIYSNWKYWLWSKVKYKVGIMRFPTCFTSALKNKKQTKHS